MEPGKRIALICFSLTGEQTGERLKKGLSDLGYQVSLSKKSRYLPDSIAESTKDWAGQRFLDSQGLIFIGSCGIAVRSIAPWIKSKSTDPAVLAVDECGTFVISLLSGHLGGANELAEAAAGILGAQPVITTATDRHHRFAVDECARKNGCALKNLPGAKELSAAVLAGEPVGIYSEFPFSETLPLGVFEDPSLRVGLAVTIHENCRPFPVTVQLVPKVVALGVGCRKGKTGEEIERAVLDCLSEEGIFREALFCMASIDLKKEEPGLLELSRRWNLPFVTASAQELNTVPGEFTPSGFVREVTGVDNVCERSAVWAADTGILIRRKRAGDGVTAALALKEWRLRFETV